MEKIKVEELYLNKLELLNALEFFGIAIKPVLALHLGRVQFAFVRKSTQEIVDIDGGFWHDVSDTGNASDIPSYSRTAAFHVLNTLDKKLKTPLRCENPLVMCPAQKGDDVRVCLTCKNYKDKCKTEKPSSDAQTLTKR